MSASCQKCTNWKATKVQLLKIETIFLSDLCYESAISLLLLIHLNKHVLLDKITLSLSSRQQQIIVCVKCNCIYVHLYECDVNME